MSSTLHDRFTLPVDPAEIERLLGGGARPESSPGVPKSRTKPRPSKTQGVLPDDFVAQVESSQPRPGLPKTPAPATQTGLPAGNGRQASGRFAHGNPGGPGNPFNRQLAELRKRFLYAVTPEQFDEAYAILIAKMRGGETAALKIFFQYTLGKPHDPVDPDRMGLAEWNNWRDSALAMKEWGEPLGSPHLETMLKIVRTMRDLANDQFVGKLLEGFEQNQQAEAKRAERAAKRKGRREAARSAGSDAPGAAAEEKGSQGEGENANEGAVSAVCPQTSVRRSNDRPSPSTSLPTEERKVEARPANGGNGESDDGPALEPSGKIDAKTLRSRTLSAAVRQGQPRRANGRNGRKRRP